MQTKIREKSLENFFNLVKSANQNDLSKLAGIYTKEHNTLPLIIMSSKKNYNSNETNACNGLILEKNTNKVVSRGFDKFISGYDDQKKYLSRTINITRSTIKEDGTLMFMFKYNDKWMLSTMYDFADSNVQFSNVTHEQLFNQIINQPLDEFAESLIKQFPKNANVMTFCFEMCSPNDIIIKEYQVSTLFLLGLYGGPTGSNEIQIPFDLKLPKNVKLLTEIHFDTKHIVTESFTLGIAMEKVMELAKNDFSFEGIILETDTEKISVKNPYYLIQHNLKYKGWSHCTPQLLVPLILDKMHTRLLSNVSRALGNDPVFNYEVNERVNYCIDRIEREYETLITVIIQLSVIQFKSNVEYMQTLKNQFPTIFSVWSSLFIEICEDIKDIRKKNCERFNQIFRRHIVNNLDKLFLTDPFIDNKHTKFYCQMNQDNIPEDLEQYDNDGISTDPQKCYCGKKIIVKKLDYNVTRYKFCHCGAAFDYIIYNKGTYLGLCEDSECLCVNEVNQETKKLACIPASTMCKSLRLNVCELVNKSNKLKKSECEELISKIPSFGISNCIKILTEFENA